MTVKKVQKINLKLNMSCPYHVNTLFGVIVFYLYSVGTVSLQSFHTNVSVRRRTFSLTSSYVARIGTPAWTWKTCMLKKNRRDSAEVRRKNRL